MTRDLEAALREVRASLSECGETYSEAVIKHCIARIDVALSAASRDHAKLKGDPDVDDYIRKEREKQARIVKGLHDYPIEGGSPPASGEARRGACFQSDNPEACLLAPACDCAASGEASGESECEECAVLSSRRKRIEVCVNPKCPSRPAPSEAPNVERAMSERDKERAVEALRKASWIAHLNDDVVRSVADALDSARAEGIAAERERCAKVAELFDGEWDLSASKIVDLIRGAKP